MSDDLRCPFCHAALISYPTGRSEFDHNCDNCGAAFAIDRAAGTARARRWDRVTAKGTQDEFPLSALVRVPD